MSTAQQSRTSELVSQDGTRVVVYRWDPVGSPRGVVQIAHLLGEHARRYVGTEAALNAAGFVVYANDHRRHGDTAGDPSRFGVFGEDGWNRLVGDVGAIVEQVHTDHPGLPVVLLGHTMGSLAIQKYLLDYSDHVDAVVLSGTTALDKLAAAIGLDQPLELAGSTPRSSRLERGVRLAQPRRGRRGRLTRRSRMWLRHRHPVVEAVVRVGSRAGRSAAAAGIRKDLPLYVVAGDQDPINAGFALLNLVVERYRAAGLTEVTVTTYEGGRHEILNETNRVEVVADLAAWLDRVLGARWPATDPSTLYGGR